MKITLIEDQAIQALTASHVGARTFDRLFAGIRFDETDGPVLYVHAKNEEIATEIEDTLSEPISAIASRILGREIELVVVLPKVIQ